MSRMDIYKALDMEEMFVKEATGIMAQIHTKNIRWLKDNFKGLVDFQ